MESATQHMAGFAVNRFSDRVGDIATGLERMAEDVRRVQARPSGVYSAGIEHSTAAHTIVHKVLWGLANLNLDALVQQGAETDLAQTLAAQEKAAPTADAVSVIDQALKRMHDGGSLAVPFVPLAWSQTLAAALRDAGLVP